MSEYIEIDSEISDDGQRIHIYTNVTLADHEEEMYESVAAMEEGSPLAQALAVIGEIAQLSLSGEEMTIVCAPDADWHAIIGDVSAAIRDFFL